MAIRILVADDFPPWPRFISSMIENTGWHIVGEAADGLEAVQKAEELKPDLILLDVGLPKLNGIEVARRLRELVPNSKILFLSALHDPNIVGELTNAIEATLRGEQFVSSSAGGRIPEDEEDALTPNGPVGNEKLESLSTPQGTEVNHCHEVQFYSNDTLLLARVTHFVGAALMVGNAAIVVATKQHRDDLFRELKAQGVDVDAAAERGAFVSLDVSEALSAFMVNDRPDAARFFEVFGKLIQTVSQAAKAEHPRVAVFGEVVALLWAEGNRDGAIQLEKLGNDLTKIHEVDILCAYPLTLHIQKDAHAFKAVCAEHSAVYVG